MERTDYPSLYQAADKASKKYQNHFIALTGFNLGFMIAGALLAIYNFQSNDHKSWVYILGSIMLVLGVFLTLIIRIVKFEDVWYQGRALAESVKTLAWGYITGSESFSITLLGNEVDQLFNNRVNELATKFTGYTKHFNTQTLLLPTITQKMKDLRNKPLDDRKSYYIQSRIKDQQDWYAFKADHNGKRRNIWFVTILVSQILAVISSYYLIKDPGSNWNLVGFFTTIASVGIAWMQLKQHEQLKQAYTTATIELRFIENKGTEVSTEQDFARFVLDSENAISREHTLWLAQKRA
jgi:hypothetical protein